ncbi:apolipoprotein A-I-like [Dendropsophus ebraccatus]|uniref:apolipoprotein A-I-like n=1 Tax=Dendropsophus ebraccatus TaxID=150705 RepID=UPI003831EFC3
MKIPVLSLFLLCLSGTYGVSIPQQNEAQPPQPTIRDSFKNLLHHSMVFGVELISTWKSSEAEREAVLGGRIELIKRSYFSFALTIAAPLIQTYHEVAKEINETYPVYNNKVMPIVLSFVVKAAESLRSAAAEIKPHFEKFEENTKEQQNAFWEEIRPIILGKVKSVIETLNSNLKPYIEDVRKEVAAAKSKEDKPPSEKDPGYAAWEENLKIQEFVQKLALFDKDLLKKMLSELQITSTKA